MSLKIDPHSCPLCSSKTSPFWSCLQQKRSFYLCSHCKLIHVPAPFWLDIAAEKQRYATHENELSNPGYREFLSRLVTPLRAKVPSGAIGLDYGCGPTQAMASIWNEFEFKVESYDLHFYPETASLEAAYDFVTCSEAVEHFRDPISNWNTLVNLLKPAGWLAISTATYLQVEQFPGWHYHRDPTHLCFYHPQTFEYLCQRYDLRLESLENNVTLLQRP